MFPAGVIHFLCGGEGCVWDRGLYLGQITIIEIIFPILHQTGRSWIPSVSDAVVTFSLAGGAGAGVFRIGWGFATTSHGVGVREGIGKEGIESGCCHGS